MNTYAYSILRYYHDVFTEEFVNIGVALLSPANRVFRFIYHSRFHRLKAAFVEVDNDGIRKDLERIQSYSHDIEATLTEPELGFSSEPVLPEHMRNLLRSLLPEDASALRFSPVRCGLSDDPEQAIADIMQNYVLKYTHPQEGHARVDDAEVWTRFSRSLSTHNAAGRIQKFRMHTNLDDYEYDGWRNDIWHPTPAQSFDYADPRFIRTAAHAWLSCAIDIASQKEKVQIDLIVAPPAEHSMYKAYDAASAHLHNAKNLVLWPEAKYDELAGIIEAKGHLPEQDQQ